MYRCTARMQNANAFAALPRDSLAHWPCRTQKACRKRAACACHCCATCLVCLGPASDVQVRQKELHRPRSIRDFLIQR